MGKLNRAARGTTDRKYDRGIQWGFLTFFKKQSLPVCQISENIKTTSAWIRYQLVLLTMTRSRYLEKCLSKEMPVEILPRTSCQPVTTCRAATAWTIRAVFVFTSPSLISLVRIKCMKTFITLQFLWQGVHGAHRLLKNHLGFCPEMSYPLISLMLALEGVVKTLSYSLLPQHLETAFISALSPLFQLEELYCLFLVGKKPHSFGHVSCHALNISSPNPALLRGSWTFHFCIVGNDCELY